MTLIFVFTNTYQSIVCLLYTSDAADERSSVDLGGRRIIKKKKTVIIHRQNRINHKKTENNIKSTRHQ